MSLSPERKAKTGGGDSVTIPANYRPCTCGAGCKYHGTEGQPCWGECIALGKDADGKWLHYCEGHAAVFYGREYVPTEKDES